MRYFLLFLFCFITLVPSAQVNSNMPPEAILFYKKAMETIKPDFKNLINKHALQFKEKNMNSGKLIIELKKDPLMKKLSGRDIEGVAVLVMVQVSKNTDEALKEKVMILRKNPEEEALKETKVLTDYNSFLAQNVEQIVNKNTVLQESVLNNLR